MKCNLVLEIIQYSYTRFLHWNHQQYCLLFSFINTYWHWRLAPFTTESRSLLVPCFPGLFVSHPGLIIMRLYCPNTRYRPTFLFLRSFAILWKSFEKDSSSCRHLFLGLPRYCFSSFGITVVAKFAHRSSDIQQMCQWPALFHFDLAFKFSSYLRYFVGLLYI